MIESELTLEEWVNTVPHALRSDPLWKSAYYRLAMYAYDLAWLDCQQLHRDFRGREIVGQLIRSSGSVCANVEEAYGRGIGSADYIRILRIALGEAREMQGWYFRARHILDAELIQRRLDTTNQIISLLVNAVSRHRRNLSKS